MRFPAAVILLAFLVTAAIATPLETQRHGAMAPPDTLTEAHGWAAEVVGSLTFSQAAYSNWHEGGSSALSLSSNLTGRFARVTGQLRQRHDSRLGYGVIRQDTLAPRKALDVIRYSFDLQHTGFGALQPTVASEIRTQFGPGYDFEPTAERYPELSHLIRPGRRLKVSDFFSPAAWTHSLGATYETGSWLRARTGLGVKQTIVLIERLRPVYGNRLDQPVRSEIGLDGLFEARGEPLENVRVQSRLTMFQAFTQVAESAPDILWENTVQLRVNRWLSVNGEFVVLYDGDVLDRVQLKEVLSVGISFTLL